MSPAQCGVLSRHSDSLSECRQSSHWPPESPGLGQGYSYNCYATRRRNCVGGIKVLLGWVREQEITWGKGPLHHSDFPGWQERRTSERLQGHEGLDELSPTVPVEGPHVRTSERPLGQQERQQGPSILQRQGANSSSNQIN